jgi:hypothetical protein
MMNFENLGIKITKNRVLDRKIWALEALKGKTLLSRGSAGEGVLVEF